MQFIKDVAIGAVIGAANIIPGVSGGTMALILGVYERLLDIISSISTSSIKAILGIVRCNQKAKQEFIAEFKRLEGFFLIKLAIGAAIAIVSLASVMTYLLREFHDPTYGFFFGLVAISAIYPYKLIKQRSLVVLIMAILGAVSVLAVTNSISNEDLIAKARLKQQIKQFKHEKKSTGNETASITLKQQEDNGRPKLVFIMVLGAVAITAMVLPGISGSFLLLLLGGYFELLKAIALRDFLVLTVFAFGCMIGLLLSTRLIQKLLHRWHDATMSFLLGLVLGSLWMIWPFKSFRTIGEETIYLNNIIPAQWGGNEIFSICTMLAGALIVTGFLAIEIRNQRSKGAA